MSHRDLVEASAIAKALEESPHQRFIRQAADAAVVPTDEALYRALDRLVERRRQHEVSLAMFAADLECEHGTCPGDERPQTPDCHCHGHGVEPRRLELVAALEDRAATRTVRGTKHTHADGLQHFTCEVCGVEWTRPAQVGRPPRTCPAHRRTDRRAA